MGISSDLFSSFCHIGQMCSIARGFGVGQKWSMADMCRSKNTGRDVAVRRGIDKTPFTFYYWGLTLPLQNQYPLIEPRGNEPTFFWPKNKENRIFYSLCLKICMVRYAKCSKLTKRFEIYSEGRGWKKNTPPKFYFAACALLNW